MKFKSLFISLLALAAAASCGTKEVVPDPVEAGITLESTADVVFPSAGGSIQVKFSSTEDWTAEVSEDWVSVTPAAGEAGTELFVTLSAATSEEYDDKTATLTLRSESSEKTVAVKQSKIGTLTVLSETAIVLEAAGGEFTIETMANDPVQAEVTEGADWIIPANEGAKGLVAYNFTFGVAANTEYLERSGKIVVSNAYSQVTVTVSQKGKPITWPTAQEGDFDYGLEVGATHAANIALADFKEWEGNGFDSSTKKVTGVITVDGITYGGPGFVHAGNRITCGQIYDNQNKKNYWSEEYPDILPAARYCSFKVNRPGTLRFYPAVISNDSGTLRIPTYYLSIVKTVNGEKIVEVLHSFVPEVEKMANANKTEDRQWSNIYQNEEYQKYWVSLSVTKADLLGIDEAATLYLFHANPAVNTLEIAYWPLEWTVADDSEPEPPAPASKPKFLLAGDSTCTAYTEEAAPQTGWGQVLAPALGGNPQVLNFAVGGESTKSFIDEGKWANLKNNILKGDIVLIQFGHNDEKPASESHFTIPQTTYKENLNTMITDVRNKGGIPVLLTPICRLNNYRSNGEQPRSHVITYEGEQLDYPAAMRELAEATETVLIDTEELTWQWLNELGSLDNASPYYIRDKRDATKDDRSHLTREGAQIVAGMIAKELKTKGLWDPTAWEE